MSFIRRAGFVGAAAGLLLASCGGSDTGASTTSAAPSTTASLPQVVADQPFPADRCAANKAAGPILYLSSFDFAASASIVDVLVAKSKGYYDAMCLDVQLKASFSVDNYPLIAANEAQFSSGGSFSEMADFAGANDAGFVALAVEGRTGIDALIVKDGAITSLAGIEGGKIGVKGAITPSVKAMLAKEGLTEGTDYQTVLLDGFDPKVHIEVPDIVGFPGYKSNEPLQLEAAGAKFRVYDPSDYDIPGSFGIVYTNRTFLQQFPTAAQDFMRATMKGLADAIADPAAAAAIAVEAINANGNTMFLSPEGETARWKVESQLVGDASTAGKPAGLPLLDLLQAEVDTYAGIGLFADGKPTVADLADPSVLADCYDASGTVIWPKG
jgi:ABC-type nitrate/sulfonate/bicarbonate transport system substrate-binding protein